MTEKEAEKDQSALDSSLYYPTIGLQTVGENVRVNFGQDAFKFDILAFVKVSTMWKDVYCSCES